MFQRNIQQPVLTALADTLVVLLNGARQSGKSTLVQRLGAGLVNATYLRSLN